MLTRASSLLHNIAASGAEEEQLLTGNLLVAHWRSCITAIINVGGPCKQKGDEIGNRNGNLKKKMLTHAPTSSRASRDTFGFFLLLRKTQSNPPETPKLQEEPQKNLNQLKLKVPDWRLKPVPDEDW